MRETAVRVSHLAKQYTIGAVSARIDYPTLRDAIAARIRRPFGNASSATTSIWALDDVTFDVGRGEVVGIIGLNGAGKSTLLKILSRITKPTRGFAEVRGRLGSLLEVGTGFHPELTGRENIFLNGAILGMRRADIARRFDAIVSFSGVERFLDTPVKRYSSGMYVRLAFAVAAHLEPEILVVDEVLAVGDVEFQKKCLGKMESVVGEGRTVLFVSHNMAAVKSLCRRAILLERGRIVADGSVDATVERYLSGSQPVSPDGLVPNGAPRAGTGEAQIRRVSLENERGIRIRQVYLGQPFRIVLDIDVSVAVVDVIVAVGITTLDGTRVATSCSTDKSAPFFALEPGRVQVAVDIGLTLLPRDYTIDCSVLRSSGYDIDTLHRLVDFTALPIAESGADVYRWNIVRGFVRPDAVWHPPTVVGEPAVE